MLPKDDIIKIANAYQKSGHSNIAEEEIRKYVQSAEFLEDILHFSRTAYIIIDCKQWKYLYCSANAAEVLGWETEEFMKGGPVFGLTRLVPEDLSIQSAVHPFMIDYLNTIPEKERRLYKFAFTSRLRQKNGNVINVLQNNFFLRSDRDGYPLLKLITFTDVSAYKTNHDVAFYITKLNGRRKNEIVLQRRFSGSSDIKISSRELTVVNAVASGLANSDIANKMGISVNTLKNHKRSIRRKLGCVNTSQMIALATLYGFVSGSDRRKMRSKVSQNS